MSSNTNTNVSKYSANPSTTVMSNFGVYQLTPVGFSDLSVSTLVPTTVNAEPCQKELIIKPFVCQIKSLSKSPSVLLSDIIWNFALYFGLNTGSADRETETAAISIHNDFFMYLLANFNNIINP